MTASTSPSTASGPTIIEEIGRRTPLPVAQTMFLLRTHWPGTAMYRAFFFDTGLAERLSYTMTGPYRVLLFDIMGPTLTRAGRQATADRARA